MFTLQIHTLDFPHPLIIDATAPPFTTAAASASAAAAGASSRSKSKAAIEEGPINEPTELRGVAHFFRRLPLPPPPHGGPPFDTTIRNLMNRTTLLFIVAVPNYFSPDDFYAFCAHQLDRSAQVCFLRDDAMEDRYSIIVKLADQFSADGLFLFINGRRFKPSENEVCHVYFILSVDYIESEEMAARPPPGFNVLPTCPVCLERLDQDTTGIRNTHCDHAFGCSCVSKWTFLSCQVCRLFQRQDEKPTCGGCGTSKIPWICLICGFVGCGRYEEGHAIKHWSDTKHSYSLEFETHKIWDYVGDKYVHRLNQSKAEGKSIVTDFNSMSLDSECGTCNNDSEDSGMGSALFSSKVETIVEEYNNLLTTQMENQRQHYEVQLAEVRSRREYSIAKAVEKAESTRIQHIQNELEKLEKDRKIVADMNEALTRNQENLRKKLKEIEERESAALKSRDEKIHDLEEQIRDLNVFIEAQKKILDTVDADGIKGGTVLPVQSNQQSDSSNSNPKRRGKSGKKRH